MDEKKIEGEVKQEAAKVEQGAYSVIEGIDHHIVFIESYVEAWLLGHPWLFYPGLALLGATAWELIEHTFGIK